MFDPLIIVISREEVNSRDISAPLGTLKQLIASPETARAYQEKLDVAFSGYDEDARELFEIPEVREYVFGLDGEFPFWLFFMSKHLSGLQCLLLCFLPPYLTNEAKVKIFPERTRNILLNRWLPAMNHISEFAGLSEDEIEQLTNRAVKYISDGKFSHPG